VTQAPDLQRTPVVAGLGARTAVGLSAETTAAAVRAGIDGFAEHPYMTDREDKPIMVAPVPYLDEASVVLVRLLRLTLPAAREAMTGLATMQESRANISVFLGLPDERPGLPSGYADRIAERLCRYLGRAVSVGDVEIVTTGHAAGLMALERGWERLRTGRAEYCLVGGVDSYLSPETLEWLEECKQLASASVTGWGFVPGEAAGFCLLSTPEAADGLPALGDVVAVSSAEEPNRIKTDTVCIGEGLTTAFRQILETLPNAEASIDQIICDLNGETYRADEFGFTMARTSSFFADAGNFLTPADCWGDVGAASGPLFVCLAIAAGRKGYAAGPLSLLWTSSESGERSATLVRVAGSEGG
jgi:3-oxoacyl-[acyl-carrier-protein] synthase-1